MGQDNPSQRGYYARRAMQNPDRLQYPPLENLDVLSMTRISAGPPRTTDRQGQSRDIDPAAHHRLRHQRHNYREMSNCPAIA